MLQRNVPAIGRTQSGLTVVELMIAVTVGLVLLGGLITFMVGNRQAYSIQQANARLQEDGRFALSLISRDLRAAGFYGCAGPASTVNSLNPAGAGFFPINNQNVTGIFGTEGAAGAPDVLTIRHSALGNVSVTAPMATTAGNISVTQPNNLQVGSIVVVADCEAGDMFQITGFDAANAIVHQVGGAGPGNINANPCTGGAAHCVSTLYGTDAKVMEVSAVQYSVAPPPTGGAPALIRTVNGAAVPPEGVISNVVDFQILYGEDTDADQTANRYVTAANVGAMANVVSVRVDMTLRSERTGGFRTGADEGRLVRNFSATIAVRNRLP